jgi:predicted AAA+ superfamily ATPase
MLQRIYEQSVLSHFAHNAQMLFLGGPRQVGKTTMSRQLSRHWSTSCYLSWDDIDDRQLMLSGQKAVAEHCQLTSMNPQKILIIFDEMHKFPDWKDFLKGFYDKYKDTANIIVTGSAQLDTLQKGGDSLMGRYFSIQIHPLSVAECVSTSFHDHLIRPQQALDEDKFACLTHFGGFPDPFLKNNQRFYNQWQKARADQLLREDIRDLSRIHELTRLGLLTDLLQQVSGQLINYSKLASMIGVDAVTLKQWIHLLEGFYFCFELKPYSKNITRSLRKNPKLYLWDWSLITDVGQRNENIVASHLLKATHYWTDLGFGKFELFFVRDKEKREVDFLIVRDDEPWVLVEAKSNGDAKLNPSLDLFHKQLKTKHAFQVAMNAKFVDKSCFDYSDPIIVPALTLLSQLV